MINYGEILNTPPYSLGKEEKQLFLTRHLAALTRHHYENCPEYRKIIDVMQFNTGNIASYYDIPFLAVRIFKEYDLMSIPREKVVKTITSSGTTGQAVSRIYLDGDTAANQTKALTKIISSHIGTKRLPMIIIDTSSVLKDRSMFSARGAGILGFSIFAKDRVFALDEDIWKTDRGRAALRVPRRQFC